MGDCPLRKIANTKLGIRGPRSFIYISFLVNPSLPKCVLDPERRLIRNTDPISAGITVPEIRLKA